MDEVVRYIDSEKGALLAFLKRYINFRSINKEQLLENEKSEIVECQQWLAEEMQKLKWFDKVDYYEVEKGRPNVVGLRKGAGKGKSLIFNSHSDVVTVSEEQKKNWSVLSPFGGELHDGKVWGRGATDMKGGAAASFFAFKALSATDLRLEGDLLLSFVDGEESGRADIGVWTLLDRGYGADFGVMCEPSDLLYVYHKTKGEIYLDIKIKGESTHICNRYKTIWPQKRKEDQLGVNAIDKMVKLVNAFTELERSWGLDYYDPDLEPGTTTVTVSMIRGGESFSSQADECTMTIASLFAPQLTVEEVKGQLLETIDHVAKRDHWLKDHEPEVSTPFPPKVPLNVDKNDDGIKALTSAYRAVMSKPAKVDVGFYVGDANYMFEKGQKCVYFGPGGAGMGVHGTDEFIPFDDVVEAAKIYAATAMEYCGVA
jgi:formylaminopyrimidine deformylase